MHFRYASFTSATHHIFFPPRLEVVVLQRDSNRLSTYSGNDLPLFGFRGQDSHRPPRLPWRRRSARQRHHLLALSFVQRRSFARTFALIDGRLHPALSVAERDLTHPFIGQLEHGPRLGCGETLV